MSPRSLFRSMFFLVLVVLIIQPLAPALGLTASSAPSKGVLEKPRPAAPSQAALVPRGELTALRFVSRSGTARRMSYRDIQIIFRSRGFSRWRSMPASTG
jgi:hypothetical protein